MSSLIRVSILKKIVGAGPLGQNFPNALAGALGPLVPYRLRHFVWKIVSFKGHSNIRDFTALYTGCSG